MKSWDEVSYTSLLLTSNRNSICSRLYLTLAHSKGQDQGRAHFDGAYLVDVDIYMADITMATNRAKNSLLSNDVVCTRLSRPTLDLISMLVLSICYQTAQ